MIEININDLIKSETQVSVKGHQTKTGYVKPYIRVIKKTAAQADKEVVDKLAVLRDYKEAAEQTRKWIADNPDRSKEIGEVNNYCVDDYDIINTLLRDEPTIDELSESMVGDQINSISSFLTDAPKFTGTTYRGMGFDPSVPSEKVVYDKFINIINNNESIILPSFTSTSCEKSQAKEFGGEGIAKYSNRIILEIKSKKGVALDGAAEFPKEMEVLFDKNSEFYVMDIKEDNGVLNVKLEEI